MGKEKKAPPGKLEYEDKVQLKRCIDQELKKYKDTVDQIYNDDYETCILMAKENTVTKNQIVRKIKFVKMKNTNLPDFVRRKKADLLV